MRLRYIVPLLVIMLVAMLPMSQRGYAQDGYEQLARRALSELGTNCANLARSSACYGFAEVSATFDTTSTAKFTAPGDRAELTTLRTLQTSAMSLTADVWGVAMLNVQANLPTGLGQSAIFILLGDTQITNAVMPADALVPIEPVPVSTIAQTVVYRTPGTHASPVATIANGTVLQADGITPDGAWIRVAYGEQAAWVSRQALDPNAGLGVLPVITKDKMTPMQAFTFQTGGTAPPSLAVPPNVLIIQSPKNIAVDIVANGIPIRVEGVIFLRTLPDGRVQLITGDGEAIVFPDAPGQVKVVAGTSIIIGGGTWTDWRIVTGPEWVPYTLIQTITVFTYQYTNPSPVTASGIGQPPTVIEIPGTVIIPITPKPPTYPRIPVEYGQPGSDLERLAWEPFSIGCGVCNPEDVFYHSNAAGNWDIYQLAGNGLSLAANNISQGPNSQDVQPSYSADGLWLAFTSNRDILGGWEIYVTSLDGTVPAPVRLTYNSGNDVNPVWGPANLIAWESNRTGNWDLFMTDVSGDGLPVRLTDDPANDINPFWLPDGGCGEPEGGRLVFQSDRDGDWEIYMLDVYSMELTKLTDNTTEDQVPVLSRDGSQMAWVQMNEFGVYDLMIMDLATGDFHKVTDMGVNVEGHTFSPDGSFLAFHANADGDYDVFAVTDDGLTLKALTTNNIEDRAPSFLCDSSRVVYHSNAAAPADSPDLREIFEVNPLPLDGPANLATRLTQDGTADDIFPIADPHEEINSKEGRVPAHP